MNILQAIGIKDQPHSCRSFVGFDAERTVRLRRDHEVARGGVQAFAILEFENRGQANCNIYLPEGWKKSGIRASA